VIDLTESAEPVPIAELRHISPRIAEAYAGKTDRTIRRDVNALAEMGLLKRSDEGLGIRRELMSAFLSPAMSGDS
jgi:DeoR/GlpR family transcriptional regulator of sugar metabolism